MLMVCISSARIYAYNIHTAWAQCCLFSYQGDTRASISGTATLQSRFFVPIMQQHNYY